MQISPSWVVQLVGPPHTPKGYGLDPWSGHVQVLDSSPGWGVYRSQLN